MHRVVVVILFIVFYTLFEEYLGSITNTEHNLLFQFLYFIIPVVIATIATVISVKYIGKKQKR